MYQAREGNDTITRERFGIENSFALDNLLVDNVKWSLNYQIAKTDQSTRERYFPFSRDVIRERDTQYQEKQWVFDAQLDKAFSVASTDHVLTYGTTIKRQKVTGLRSGSGTCARVFGSCRAVGADSPSDRLAATSDFPTRPSPATRCLRRTRSAGMTGPSCPACATTIPGSIRHSPRNSSDRSA